MQSRGMVGGEVQVEVTRRVLISFAELKTTLELHRGQKRRKAHRYVGSLVSVSPVSPDFERSALIGERESPQFTARPKFMS